MRHKRPGWVLEPVQTPGSSQPTKKKVKLTDPATGGNKKHLILPINEKIRRYIGNFMKKLRPPGTLIILCETRGPEAK